MPALQKLIHVIEVGGGLRYVRIGAAVLALLLFAVCYNWRAFKNMSSQEAMDAAQLARNIAAGDGYTTLLLRPLSIYLLQQHRQQGQPSLVLANAETAELTGMHPDLANPPVYPMALAGLMWALNHTKILAFHYPISEKAQPFWTIRTMRGTAFYRYQPDFLISVFNQLLFLALLLLVYFLARRLFDPAVAGLSALLLLGTELFWRFSVSGLSTMLLLIVFAGLAWSVFLLEEESREAQPRNRKLFGLAALAGLEVGLGALTRYSFAWLLVPLLVFVLVFCGRQRIIVAVLALLTFAVVVTPWVIRNYRWTGTPLGTASYTMLESTSAFPEYKLQRSLQPDFSRVNLVSAFWQKLAGNARVIVENDLPKLGGNWASAFFLAGLLIGFRRPAVRRLRYFLVGCILVLAVVQALGRTQLSEDSPDINTENLLVLVAPLILVYGVSLFYLLLDQVELPFREVRYLAIGVFAGVVCLPLLLTFVGPHSSPISFPPYYPPSIQKAAGYIKPLEGTVDAKGVPHTDPGELMMSDIPAAVAWYGYSQCIWATISFADFFTINDFVKPINAFYLTPKTTEHQDKAGDWRAVLIEAEVANFTRSQKDLGWPRQVDFGSSKLVLPLHWWQQDETLGWPNVLLLTSRPRWPKES